MYLHRKLKLLLSSLSYLQSTSSLQIGEELDDVLGHRWRSRQMVTGSLESVLISDPVDGDDDTIRRGVRVRSAGDGTDILGFRSNLLLASTFLYLGPVSALKTIEIINYWIFIKSQVFAMFNNNLRISVASVRVHFAVGWNNSDGFIAQLCGQSNGEECGNNDLSRTKCKNIRMVGSVLGPNTTMVSTTTYEFHFKILVECFALLRTVVGFVPMISGLASFLYISSWQEESDNVIGRPFSTNILFFSLRHSCYGDERKEKSAGAGQ